MAKFKITDPDGNAFVVKADTVEQAHEAVLGMAGGAPRNFDQGFNPSAPGNAAAERPEIAGAMDQNIHGEADSRGRAATVGNSLTMGFGDEVMGLLGGGITFAQGEGFEKGYNRMTQGVRGDIDQFAERRPNEALALEVAGALPTAMLPGGAAVRGATLGTKMARGAMAGGAYGAVAGYGAGEGGVQNRVDNAASGAAIGAGIGTVVPAAGHGIGKYFGGKAGKKAVPTSQQWEDRASGVYQTADNLGVAVGSRALQRIATLRQGMGNAIADPNVAPEAFKELYPKTLASLQVLDGIAKNQTMTLRNVETYRGMLLDAAFDATSPKDGRYAGIILRKFDDWADNLHATEYVGANAAGPQAQQLYKEARRLWRTKSKAQTIEAVVRRAGDNTVDSWGNAAFAQALVTGFKQLRRNDALMAGFSDTEKKFIRDAAGGRWDQKTLKGIDMMTPGFSLNRIGQAGGWGTASALSGSPVPMLVAGAAGTGARIARNRSIIKSADRAGQVMRNQGAVPFDPIAAKASEDYATRLLSAGGQAGGTQVLDLGDISQRGVPPEYVPAR